MKSRFSKDATFTHYLKDCSVVNSTADSKIVILKFGDSKIANLFLTFVKEHLPLFNTEYPKSNDNNVYLTSEQYLFCQRQVMWESGNLKMDYLKDCLLKTLRADQFDFSYQFIQGIIPGENNSRRLHNLRPSQRKPYLIRPDGYVSYRLYKRPQYTKEQKIGFSQSQSNTLLDPNALSRAFGFSKNQRNNKLYGIVTHLDDALFNRLLTDDSGTVNRIFDYDTNDLAYNAQNQLKGYLFTKEQLEEFKIANKKARLSNPRTNEVLARIRFNPYRTVVSICTDTLEARLLAYDFAEELLEEYKNYALKNGLKVNPNYKIPIIFYCHNDLTNRFFSTDLHSIRPYTDQMRENDKTEAVSIYTREDTRIKHFRNNDFEFLLGLPNITKETLLDPCLGHPLVYVMMKNGYTRMLMRLLKTPLLRKQVFDSLTDEYHGLLKQNDPIIANLVLAEQFDLADALIKATNSDQFSILIERSEHKSLSTHILDKGNPRQLAYMGLDTMILLAAEQKKWVTVRLCLKELSHIKKETLKRLLEMAIENNEENEPIFILDTLSESEEVILLLFDLGLVLSGKWWGEAFRVFIRNGRLKAASSILTHQKLNDENFDQCMESLKYYPQHILFLSPFLYDRVKPAHIRNQSFMQISPLGDTTEIDHIIAMMQQIKNPILNSRAYLWDFYFVLDYSTLSENLELEKELARLLHPSVIKHMILVFIIDRFRCYLKPFKDNVTTTDSSAWPNLTTAFKTKGSLIDFNKRELIETIDTQQNEILALLNNYFNDIDTIPSDETIEATYTQVMELFDHAPPCAGQFDINTTFAVYMRSLDIEMRRLNTIDEDIDTTEHSHFL